MSIIFPMPKKRLILEWSSNFQQDSQKKDFAHHLILLFLGYGIDFDFNKVYFLKGRLRRYLGRSKFETRLTNSGLELTVSAFFKPYNFIFGMRKNNLGLFIQSESRGRITNYIYKRLTRQLISLIDFLVSIDPQTLQKPPQCPIHERPEKFL